MEIGSPSSIQANTPPASGGLDSQKSGKTACPATALLLPAEHDLSKVDH